MLAHWYGLLSDRSPSPPRVEPEEEQPSVSYGRQSKAVRIWTPVLPREELKAEVEQVVERLKTSEASEVNQVKQEVAAVSGRLKEWLFNIAALQAQYQQQYDEQRAYDLQQAQALEALLIAAQLEYEAAQQQAEELDVAYIMFMLCAFV